MRNAGGGITASGIVVSDVLSTNLGAPTSLPAGCTYNASTRRAVVHDRVPRGGRDPDHRLATTPVVARKGNRVDNTVTGHELNPRRHDDEQLGDHERAIEVMGVRNEAFAGGGQNRSASLVPGLTCGGAAKRQAAHQREAYRAASNGAAPVLPC